MEIVLQLLPLVLVFGVFYFMLIVPEKKRKKNYESMIEGLALNDEVMTRGGIVGKIVSMDGEYFVLENGPDRVRMKFVKSAIANKVYKDNE
ncbi:MAG: preprotein translocase subunit YajC [Clostridium sp.]